MELAQRLGRVVLERGAAHGMCKMVVAAGHSCSAETARLGPSCLLTEGLMRALLFQMALGAEVILGSPHRTGSEGVWAGSSATHARGSCTVISIPNPSASTAQPLPRSPSLNKEVTPSSPPVSLPRGLPAPCTHPLPGRQRAARAARGAGALGHWAGFLEGNVLPRIAESICLHTSGNSCPDVYRGKRLSVVCCGISWCFGCAGVIALAMAVQEPGVKG